MRRECCYLGGGVRKINKIVFAKIILVLYEYVQA